MGLAQRASWILLARGACLASPLQGRGRDLDGVRLAPHPRPLSWVLRGKGRKASTCEMLWARDCQHHEGDRTRGGQRGLCHIPVLALWLCDLREMAEPLCAVVRPCSKR